MPGGPTAGGRSPRWHCVGAGSAAHVVSHLVGPGLGGRPETDIPFFTLLAAALLAAGADRVGRRG